MRFSRDKRGYEHVYLVDAPNQRDRSSRARVLFWFRTPPGIKVGRAPFDAATQRVLEAQHPDVTFDWARIVATPMPPAVEVENWRERRRAEKSVRRARAPETPRMPTKPVKEPSLPEAEIQFVEAGSGRTPDGAEPVAGVEPTAPAASSGEGADPARRRRRRRGRSRRGAENPQPGPIADSSKEG